MKKHISLLGFTYTSISDVALLIFMGYRLYQKVGSSYAFFNKIGFDSSRKTFKVFIRPTRSK